MNRLILLAGPSCVRKSPLHAALVKFHPQVSAQLRKLILFNSRAPRPGEADGKTYHFRRREEIEALRGKENFVVLDVRGDLQAVDMAEVRHLLQTSNGFFEGNPFIACELLSALQTQWQTLSIFLSPLSKAEILFLKSTGAHVALPDFIADVMRRKLLRRTQRQKGILSLRDLENIERRAASAFGELKLAGRFDFVIPNHDGEDSENWDAFYFPIGEARRTLETFRALIEGRASTGVEKWEAGLLDAG